MALVAERWQQLRILVAGCENKTRAERASFLRQECGSDRELLEEAQDLFAAIETDDDPIANRIARAAETLEPQALFEPGSRLGEYEIRALLGQGGMGAVYLAEKRKEDFSLTVAIKVIADLAIEPERQGLFAEEIRNLAELNHPNIARLLDGGRSDGGAFLVMEFVDGDSLLQYVGQRRVAERLRLFISVCQAVQHAHTRLVVHCDIKPANILVDTEGIPKLLDFGVATTLARDRNAERGQNRRALTPGYASPEQIAGDPVGTTTDIYSLGLLLYELVAEQPAFRLAGEGASDAVAGFAVDAWLKQRRDWRPRPIKALDAELTSVVARATALVPADRYSSVPAMIADLEDYLSGRPVRTMGPGLGYRVRKFCRRHAAPVALGVALCLALIGYGATAYWQGQKLRAERDRLAEERAVKSDALNFVTSMLTSVDPLSSADNTIAITPDYLEQVVSRANALFESAPLIRAEIYAVVADILQNLGRHEESLALAEQSLEIIENNPGSDVSLSNIKKLAGDAAKLLGRNDDSRRYYLEAVADIEASQLPETEKLFQRAILQTRIAIIHRDEGDYATARELFAAGESILRRIRNPSLELGEAIANLGLLSILEGNNEIAIRHLTAAREVTLAAAGTRHANFGRQTEKLATAYRSVGDLDSAEALYQEALASLEPALGETHNYVINVYAEYGRLLLLRGNVLEAERSFARAVRGSVATFGEEHRHTAIHRTNQAHAALASGETDRARRIYASAQLQLEATMPKANPYRASILLGIAMVDVDAGLNESALTAAREATEILEATAGDRHWYTRFGRCVVQVALLRGGEIEAESARGCLSSLREVRDERDFRVRWVEEALSG